MSSDNFVNQPLANSEREPAVVVFASGSRASCAERALVLGTQGIANVIAHDDNRYLLLVEASSGARARTELELYERENADWPPPRKRDQYAYLNGWPGVIGYVFLMVLVAWLSATRAGGLDWFGTGKVDAGRIVDGQWWRAITALTLHLDLPHLAGNLVFGSAFGYLAGRYFGSGLAWLAIVAAGALGNILNSVLLAPSHTSVGASTAIFGALGMVSAFIWKYQTDPGEQWARRLGPIVAGIALLAYTGTGGERTDVSAHLTGFISGFGLGVLFALVLRRLPRGPRAQWLSGALALAIVAFSWTVALA